ncbi:MAG: G1 family glutamic endopeptidase [Solirubrobacteraceae bacterium]
MDGLCAGICAIGLAPAPALAAAPRHSARDLIASFSASPARLPSKGGTVHLRGSVRGATTCSISATPTVAGLPVVQRCTSGAIAITLKLAANSGRNARAIGITLTAASNHGQMKRHVALVEEGAASSQTASRPAAPVVTTQPASASVLPGVQVSFTARASGVPTPSVQWQSSSNGGASWSAVATPTATTTMVTVTATSASSGLELRAVFSNSVGSATSSIATLTVGAAPAIAQQPIASATVQSGQSVVLVAGATGSPAPAAEWQSSTNGGVSWSTLGSGSLAVRGGVSYSQLSEAAGALGSTQYRAVFSNQLGSQASSTETVSVIPATSYNWSGYVASGTTFSAVSGRWTVPAVSCAGKTTSAASEWVGIDGWNAGSDVEQAGTETDCDGGAAHYYAWYELFGDSGNWSVNNGGQVTLPPADGVEPGDSLTATVSFARSQWMFALTDARGGTQLWTFSSPPVGEYWPPPPQSTAEWVVECTTGCSSIPLTNFGTVPFSSATATAAGAGVASPISAFPFTAVAMYGPGQQIIAAPGPLAGGGSSFTDSYDG